MKRLFLALSMLILFTAHSVWGQNRSIRFNEKPFKEILNDAKAAKKMIFLDAYTTWCGPCKWMAANIFTNDTVSDFYNSNFLCCHFDMEKGEGLELARAYQVRAYPTLLFLNPDGQVVHMAVGAPRKVSDYINMGKVALTPGEGFVAYFSQYQNGRRDAQFMLTYFERMQGAYQPITDQLKQYFDSVSDADLLKPVNWDILNRYEWDINSKAFQFLLKHNEDFDKAFTTEAVSAKISKVFSNALTTLARARPFNEAEYTILKEKILNSGFPGAGQIIATFENQMKPK